MTGECSVMTLNVNTTLRLSGMRLSDLTSVCVFFLCNPHSLLSPPGFIGKITLQIPFYRPHSDPWVISMSQLNLIIGPAQLQEYDGEKEKEEESERKKRLLKALEDRFKVGGLKVQKMSPDGG